MALTDQRHTVRFPLPDLIVRGAAHTLYAPVYLDGALVNPSGATPTVTVYNASNVAVISADATVTGDIATYAIGAGDLTAQDLGTGWRVEWALTLAGGEVLTPRNDAALVRNALWPVISDVDIYRAVGSLDPSGTAPIHSQTNVQTELDEAWTQINSRLISLGNRPNLILEPSALRGAHMNLTLAIFFESHLASRLNDTYQEMADDYRARYERAWAELNPRYDTGDDGRADSRRRAMQPTVWLSSRGGRTVR